MPAKKVKKGVRNSGRVAKKTPKRAGAKKKARVAKRATAPRTLKKAGKSTPAAKRVSLGRPKVTGEEKLYLLFREDYHARQIFEFLRVETVKELEQFSPQQIVDRLSAPIVETVHRIRKTLAQQNRALAGDQEFAAGWKKSAAGN